MLIADDSELDTVSLEAVLQKARSEQGPIYDAPRPMFFQSISYHQHQSTFLPFGHRLQAYQVPSSLIANATYLDAYPAEQIPNKEDSNNLEVIWLDGPMYFMHTETPAISGGSNLYHWALSVLPLWHLQFIHNVASTVTETSLKYNKHGKEEMEMKRFAADQGATSPLTDNFKIPPMDYVIGIYGDIYRNIEQWNRFTILLAAQSHSKILWDAYLTGTEKESSMYGGIKAANDMTMNLGLKPHKRLLCSSKGVVPGYSFQLFHTQSEAELWRIKTFKFLGITNPTKPPPTVYFKSTGRTVTNMPGKQASLFLPPPSLSLKKNTNTKHGYVKSFWTSVRDMLTVRCTTSGTSKYPSHSRWTMISLWIEVFFALYLTAYSTLWGEHKVWQVSLTGVFVGAHGAGMTNIMFLPTGSAVIELFPYKWWPSHYRCSVCFISP